MSRDNIDSSEEELEELGVYGMSMISISGDSKHDCGYCKKKDTSISYGIWAHSMTCEDYQGLIDRGWRRSGQYLYKPDLEKSCCPMYTIRLDTTRFSISKSQRKIVNKFNRYVNGSWDPDSKDNKTLEKPIKKQAGNCVQINSLIDLMHEPETDKNSKYKLEIKLEPASFTKEKYNLYAKYQRAIHNSEDDDITEGGFKRFLVNSPMKIEKNNNVNFGSYHQKYILDGKLIALAVIDILPKCVSSVYFIYDPDYSFLGLGKYSVFREISLVQEYYDKFPSLKYYYMGYYIDSCPKMKYKGQYLPSDLLDPLDYTWYPIEDFKKEFDQGKSFVSFSELMNKKRNYTSGWLDPTQITDEDLEKVYILIESERAVPVTFLAQFESTKKLRKSVIEFVCSVGLDLAQRIFVC